MWWGYSEALDLQEECEVFCDGVEGTGDSDEVNILLVGSCDGRHILKTMSKTFRHRKRKLNIYVLEPVLELCARQLMLLSIALEPPEEQGLLEKARIFMEVYGNTLLRPNTVTYLANKAVQLAGLVTGGEEELPGVSLSLLKHRDRDGLEDILQWWSSGGPGFDVVSLWDKRLRGALGVRYDHRDGVFDWDYHMRLRTLGGAQVGKAEYLQFRRNGVAFTWLECEGSRVNPSLASAVFRVGQRTLHGGYIGDVAMGAYPAYGLHCEDAAMLRTAQGVPVKRATDITERNLLCAMSELEHHAEYVHRETALDELDLGVAVWVEAEVPGAGDAGEKPATTPRKPLRSLPVDDVTVRFLPPGWLMDLEKLRVRYPRYFHVIWVSLYLERYLEALMGVARPGALILLEGRLFVMSHRKEDLIKHWEELKQRVDNLEVKCDLLKKFDPCSDTVARFRV